MRLVAEAGELPSAERALHLLSGVRRIVGVVTAGSVTDCDFAPSSRRAFTTVTLDAWDATTIDDQPSWFSSLEWVLRGLIYAALLLHCLGRDVTPLLATYRRSQSVRSELEFLADAKWFEPLGRSA